MRAFFDAWREGDEDGQKIALGKVVESWRADNAAGGMPVHGHLPLPKDFADKLRQLATETSDQVGRWSPAVIIDGLSEGAHAAVGQQLAADQLKLASQWMTNFSGADRSPREGTAALTLETPDQEFAHAAMRNTPQLDEESAGRLSDVGHEGLRWDEGRRPAFELASDENWTGQVSEAFEHPPGRTVRGGGEPLAHREDPRGPRVHANTVFQGSTPDGRFLIRRNFKLSRPAHAKWGGWIVQTVKLTVQYIDDHGRPVGPPRKYEWSEAWRVSPGKDRPLEVIQGDPRIGLPGANDSIGGPLQDRYGAIFTVMVITRFYDGQGRVPEGFERGRIEPAGNLFATEKPFDQLRFDVPSGPATVTSFPPIVLKAKGQR